MTTETKTTVDLSRAYTVDEYMQLSFEGDKNSELIGGKIVVAPPLGDEHGQIADEIRYHIFRVDPERKLGKVWMNSRFRLTEVDAPAPDLGFVVAERVAPRTAGVIPVTPDLAVEVISPSDELKDINKKIELYQQAQVGLIWVIWSKKQRVDVYQRGQTKPVKELGPGEMLDGEDVIPGLKIPVKKLFEDW